MLRIPPILYSLFLFVLFQMCIVGLVLASEKGQPKQREQVESVVLPKALYSSSFNREPSYVPGGDEFYPLYGNNAMFGDDNLWSSALSRHLRFHMMRTPIGRRAALIEQ